MQDLVLGRYALETDENDGKTGGGSAGNGTGVSGASTSTAAESGTDQDRQGNIMGKSMVGLHGGSGAPGPGTADAGNAPQPGHALGTLSNMFGLWSAGNGPLATPPEGGKQRELMHRAEPPVVVWFSSLMP
jgi:hypothetical protein